MQEHPPRLGRVAGKTALVTGAASGIGRATAVLLAEQGASVFCADLDSSGSVATAADITAVGGQAWPCQLDVTSEEAWSRTMEQIDQTREQLDIAVNCAGISFSASVVDMTLQEWRRVMAVNLEGVFLGTKHSIRVMRQHGHNSSIVNVASASGIKAAPGASAYCASKAAVILFSKTAALECSSNGDRIRVNVVSPGGVKTAMWKSMPFFQELMAKEGGEEEAFQAMVRAHPTGRFALPEEIGQAIVYLASDESLYVTGTNLVIDNGYTA
jgi:NAD(P)-dependent dehydrogenase (short-subunit alcohol dehydrogenase family)